MSSNRNETPGILRGEFFSETLPPPPVTPTPTPTSTPAPSQYDTGYTNLHTMILDDNPHALFVFPAGSAQSVDLTGNSSAVFHSVNPFTLDPRPFSSYGYSNGATTGFINFTGLNDTDPDTTLLPVGSDYSIELMVYVDAAAIAEEVYCSLFSTYDFYLNFGSISGGPPTLHVRWFDSMVSDTVRLDLGPFFNFNRWNHLVLVADTSGTPEFKVYCNNQLAVTIDAGGFYFADNSLYPPQMSLVGDGSGSETFISFDTIAIYHRQLTLQEISDRTLLVATGGATTQPLIVIPEAFEPRPTPTPTPTPSFVDTIVAPLFTVDFSNIQESAGNKFAYDSNDEARIKLPDETRIVEAGLPLGSMVMATNASSISEDSIINYSYYDVGGLNTHPQYSVQMLVNYPTLEDDFSLFSSRFFTLSIVRQFDGDLTLQGYSSVTDVTTVANIMNVLNGSRIFMLTISRDFESVGAEENFIYRVFINGSPVLDYQFDNALFGENDSYQNIWFGYPNLAIGDYKFYDVALTDAQAYSHYNEVRDVITAPEDFYRLYPHEIGSVPISGLDFAVPADFRAFDSNRDILIFSHSGIYQEEGSEASDVNGFIRFALFDKNTGFINPTTKTNHYVDSIVDVVESIEVIAHAEKTSLRDPLVSATRDPLEALPQRFVTRNNLTDAPYLSNIIGCDGERFIGWSSDGHVYRTLDAGYNWELCVSTGSFIYDILWKQGSDEFIILATGVHKTTNFGDTFTSYANPFGSTTFRGGNAASSTTYVVHVGNNTFRSTNGNTWTSTFVSTRNAPSRMVWHDSASLFILVDSAYGATSFDVLTSPTGATWTNRNGTFVGDRSGIIRDLHYHDGVTTLLTGFNGIFVSSDAINFALDETILPYSSGYTNVKSVMQSVADPNQVFILLTANTLVMYDRVVGGDWTLEVTQLSNGQTASMANTDTRMMVCGYLGSGTAFSVYEHELG